MVQPKTPPAKDPRVEWIDITPELAAEYLRRNTLNRPKKPQKIALYTADMKAGAWPVTGATIQFGRSGRLLDGQNRLQAIVDSGVSVRMLVVFDIDDDTFDVIDSGARRTASDILVIEGWEGWVAATGATAARVAMNLAAGNQPYSQSFSPQSVRRFVTEHPDLMNSVEFMAELPRRPAPLPHSACASLHFYMAQLDAPLADELMTQLFRGDGMSASDLVLRLRNALLGRVQQGMTGNTDVVNGLAAVVRAWNARRRGSTIAHITNAFRREEAFPAIK
jgi:hypothetical protein